MFELGVFCERLGEEEWFWGLVIDCWIVVVVVGVIDCIDCRVSGFILKDSKCIVL